MVNAMMDRIQSCMVDSQNCFNTVGMRETKVPQPIEEDQNEHEYNSEWGETI